MTTATAPTPAELLDRLAAAPKPGEWVGNYRVTCSALRYDRPDEVLVFATGEGGVRWACRLDSWRHYRATGSFLDHRLRPLSELLDRMKQVDAECPGPSREFNGDEVLGSGLGAGDLLLMAFRDRAGVAWACTPAEWDARQAAAWAAIEPEDEASAPCAEPTLGDPARKPAERRIRARMLTPVGWTDGALQVGDEVELLPEHSLPDADLVAITSPKLRTWRLVARKRLDPILEEDAAPPDHWDEVRAQVEGMAASVCRELAPDEPAPTPEPGSDEALAAFVAAGPGPGIGNRVGEFEVVAYGIDETTAGSSPSGVVFVRHTAHGSDLRMAAPADLWGARGWNVSRTYPMDSIAAAMARLRDCPAVGSRHRHYKGTVYEVVAVGCHALTLEPMVAYTPAEGPMRGRLVWARTLLGWTTPVQMENGIVPRFAPDDGGPIVRLDWAWRAFSAIQHVAAALGYDELAADLAAAEASDPPDDPFRRVERRVTEAARKADRLGDWSDYYTRGPAGGPVPWTPPAGSEWRARDGRRLVVLGVGRVHGVGRVVFHSQERPGLTPKVACTAFAEWHRLTKNRNGYAVRRFAPIPAPSTQE